MKSEESPAPGAFDEARALAELERLRAQIIQARAARGRVQDEFEAFVRGFRSERYGEEAARASDDLPAPPRPGSASTSADPIGSDRTSDMARGVSPAVSRPVPSRQRSTRGAAVVLIAAVVLGAGVFAARARRGRPISPAPVRSTAAAKTEGQPAAGPAVLPVPDPPAPAGVDMELRTLRRVWVRVTIDGRRAFERELAADQRIPLHANRTIQIRAGDAGAVALTRDGLDTGPLGRDGTIATREFTVDMPAR